MIATRRGSRNVAARSATTTTPSASRPDAGPGPAVSASIRAQRAPGTVSIPDSVASRSNGRSRQRSTAVTTPEQHAAAGAREAGGEPDHEDDEPEREEIEAVAIVEPLESVRRAAERRDHEKPADVGGGEQRDERRSGTRSDASGAGELPEHDRRDRDGDDREVDGEVAEVVHEPLPDLHRVVVPATRRCTLRASPWRFRRWRPSRRRRGVPGAPAPPSARAESPPPGPAAASPAR